MKNFMENFHLPRGIYAHVYNYITYSNPGAHLHLVQSFGSGYPLLLQERELPAHAGMEQ